MPDDYAEVYQDKGGKWRSRIKAANNKTLFDSGEGYDHKEDVVAVLTSRMPYLPIEYPVVEPSDVGVNVARSEATKHEERSDE